MLTVKTLDEMKSEVAKEHGISPDAYTYNHLLKMYSDKHQVEKAQEIFETMKQQDVPFNIVTLNNMLRVYARYGKQEKKRDFRTEILET